MGHRLRYRPRRCRRILAALAVYLLAGTGVQAYRLVLVGTAGFAVNAFTLPDHPRRDQRRASMTVWLTGSLNGRSWDEVRIVAVAPATWAARNHYASDSTGSISATTPQLHSASTSPAGACWYSSPSASPPRRRCRPDRFRGIRGRADRPSPRQLAECLYRACGIRRRVGHRRCRPRSTTPARPDRTPGRHHDRRTRRPVPTVAARPPSPDGGTVNDRSSAASDDVPSRLEPQ